MSSNHGPGDPRLASRSYTSNAISSESSFMKRSSRVGIRPYLFLKLNYLKFQSTSESMLGQRSQKIAKYDFNSNVPRRDREGDHVRVADVQARRRTRSQSFASISNEDLALKLSPKAHSESFAPISSSNAPLSPSESSVKIYLVI